jgi:hypothetical protein
VAGDLSYQRAGKCVGIWRPIGKTGGNAGKASVKARFQGAKNPDQFPHFPAVFLISISPDPLHRKALQRIIPDSFSL